MKAKTIILIALVGAVYLLHQDYWNWKDYKPLIFGFLPVGMAYHAAYSIAASALMVLLVRFIWPSHLESVERHDPSNPPGESRE